MPDDRRLIEAIARAHGHGPRRTVALLDIAWAEMGSEGAARAGLQRLVMLGLVELTPGSTRDAHGRLTDKGAELLARE